MYSRRERIESERGFALILSLVLALLFLALIALVLADTGAALRTAERVRGRVLADILAENGVELAAQGLLGRASQSVDRAIEGGHVKARLERTGEDRFRIASEAVADGPFAAMASVEIAGRVTGDRITIDRSRTTPGGGGTSGPEGSEGGVTLRR